MVDLPNEAIVFEILTRMPAKVVGRSKSVCKEWYTLLSREYFVGMHCSRSLISSNQRILHISDLSCSVYPINFQSGDYGQGTIIHFPFNAQSTQVLVLAELHGLVCVCLRHTSNLLLWNPTTCAYKHLLTPDSHGLYEDMDDAIGLYIDAHDDFKVLHLKRRHGLIGVYIYSRRGDSWRSIPFITRPKYCTRNFYWSSGTLCGGTLYFALTESRVPSKNVVFGFDINSEQFKEISFPPHDSNGIVLGKLMNVRNVLHMFLSTGYREISMDLWKLEEECWVKVFLNPPIPNMTLSDWCAISYIMTNGNWFLLTNLGKLYETYMDTKSSECLYSVATFTSHRSALFLETIFPPSL